MQLCKQCKKHCLPISFSDYITQYFGLLDENIIVPDIEIDNGLFKRMARLSSATASGLSYFYSLKSEVMKQIYSSTMFFHASTLYLIDIGVELILDWYKVISAWNKFLGIRDEKCRNFNSFLVSSFKELITKAIKVKRKLGDVLSERGQLIAEYTIKSHSKVGEQWFYPKLKELDPSKSEDFYVNFVYEVTSLLSTFINVFIGVALSADQLLENKRIIYTQGFAHLFLDGVDVVKILVNTIGIEPREVRVLRPDILTTARINVAELGLHSHVY